MIPKKLTFVVMEFPGLVRKIFKTKKELNFNGIEFLLLRGRRRKNRRFLGCIFLVCCLISVLF